MVLIGLSFSAAIVISVTYTALLREERMIVVIIRSSSITLGWRDGISFLLQRSLSHG